MKTSTPAKRGRFTVQWMTGTALMIALELVLGSTPLGRITMPFLTATTMHIPVIIASLVLGLESGVIVGLVFGVHSLISNLTGASFFAPFFINPLVSVLPRALFPVAVCALAKGVERLTSKIDPHRIAAYVLASALGTALHTAMVMSMIGALYGGQISEMIASGASVPEAVATKGVAMGLAAMGAANGVPEAIVAAVIAPVVTLALDKAVGRIPVRR